MMYNKVVQDCFFKPQHVGHLDVAEPRTVSFSTADFSHGAVIELFMQGDEHQTVSAMCFKTNGNPYVVAALEWICRASIGKNVNQLSFNGDELIKLLEVPTNQSPVILQVQDVYLEVMNLIRSLYRI